MVSFLRVEVRTSDHPTPGLASLAVPANAMPQPGDVHPGFIAESGRCWRMVYDGTLQATHCPEPPASTGRWFAPSGERWWRVWACPEHLEGLTGLREFGPVSWR
jgi:hypothetical protein